MIDAKEYVEERNDEAKEYIEKENHEAEKQCDTMFMTC
jgi:hypothetical protein